MTLLATFLGGKFYFLVVLHMLQNWSSHAFSPFAPILANLSLTSQFKPHGVLFYSTMSSIPKI